MPGKTVATYVTAQNTGQRLARGADIAFEPDVDGQENLLVNVHPDICWNEIEGFGGAFTEASAVTLSKVPREVRERALRAYFDPVDGLGYSLCRTHIHSCDFALGNYTYVQDGDASLASFDVARDREQLLPMIRDAAAIRGSAVRILASPWSPPGWMKTTGQMNRGGRLLEEHRQTWASYVSRYVGAYAAEGVPIWAVTVQNEPKAVQRWDSCVWTAEEERDFVRDYLGPTLERDGHGDVKILVWDHNKERIYERARVVLSDDRCARYVWGVACHWYSGDHFDEVALVRQRYPGTHVLFTEGCREQGTAAGDWTTGERYAHDIIGDLNAGVAGFIDWNMVLDEQGGPNHVGNYCAAPIIADTRTGELSFQSSYWYIGHFSRFIRPGAVRLAFSRYTDRLEVTAARNPDGTFAVVAMNRTEAAIPFVVRVDGRLARCAVPPRAIVTLVW